VDIHKNTVYSKPYNAVSFTRAFNNHKIHSISLKERESVDNFKAKVDLAAEKGEVDLLQPGQDKLEEALGQQMIVIWQQCVGDPGLSYRARRLLINLHTILREQFEGSLYRWQVYCKKISSSKFLMGEGKAWKLKRVFLLWAVKADNIAKVNGNAISLGDRVIPLTPEQLKVNTQRFDLLHAIKAREDNLRTLECDIQRLRRSAVVEHIDKLFENDTAELENYQGQFEAMLKQGNVSQDPKWSYQTCREYFKASGWQQMNRDGNGLFNQWRYFRSYLTQLFADQHFKQTQQQMLEERQQEIEENLTGLQHKLEQVNAIMNLR
jgi:hypothetical protein